MKIATVVLAAFLLVASAQEQRRFPDDFIFGAATSAYQIEGGWNADDKGENIWDYLAHNRNDLIEDGSSGDVACDSYTNWKRDVQMLKELGVDFYRFSLSWSRLLPSGFSNKISAAGLAYYNNLIDELLANGITPMVTLYHWDLPQPLQDMGGWANPLIEKYFEDYARVAFQAFGDRVKTWLTFNEPKEICLLGYGYLDKAPALNFQGVAEYLCAHTLIKSHAKAYRLYDTVFRPQQNGRISLTLSTLWFEPENNSTATIEAAKVIREFEIGWYAHPIFSKEGDYPAVMKEMIAQRSRDQGYRSSRLPEFTEEEVEYIKGTFDFFGINHYSTRMVKGARTTQGREPSFDDDHRIDVYTDPDWPTGASPWLKVVPWGFTKLLNWMHVHYDKPEIVILENGYTDDGGRNDTVRIDFFRKYLNAMLDAMDEGVNVSGYTAWSLMDNMEWLEGYKSHFGLFEVDFTSPAKTRTAKNSAKFYSDIIKNRVIG